MSVETRTFRLAVGLFDDGDKVVEALEELDALGLSQKELCLVSPPGCTDEDLRAAGERLGQWQGLVCSNADEAVLESLLHPLRPENMFSIERDCPPSWLSDAHYARLKQHVVQGGLGLVVSSSSPIQHDWACRILLRHSRYGVQSYDFTSRHTGSESGPNPHKRTL